MFFFSYTSQNRWLPFFYLRQIAGNLKNRENSTSSSQQGALFPAPPGKGVFFPTAPRKSQKWGNGSSTSQQGAFFPASPGKGVFFFLQLPGNLKNEENSTSTSQQGAFFPAPPRKGVGFFLQLPGERKNWENSTSTSQPGAFFPAPPGKGVFFFLTAHRTGGCLSSTFDQFREIWKMWHIASRLPDKVFFVLHLLE